MFDQRRPPMWAVIAVAILVLVGVSSMAHGAGWSDGYQMGLLASGGKISPQALHHAGWGYHHGGMGFFGGFFRFVFFLFFLGLIAKFFGFWRWRMHHGGHSPHHFGWHQHSQPGTEQPTTPQASTDAQTGEQKPQNTSWINV